MQWWIAKSMLGVFGAAPGHHCSRRNESYAMETRQLHRLSRARDDRVLILNRQQTQTECTMKFWEGVTWTGETNLVLGPFHSMVCVPAGPPRDRIWRCKRLGRAASLKETVGF